MRPVSVSAVVVIVLFADSMIMAQTQVSSQVFAGSMRQAEVLGKVVASSTSESTLEFRDTPWIVKLRNVTFKFFVPDPAVVGGPPKYVLPCGLQLDAIELNGTPLTLTTNIFDGPCITISKGPRDRVTASQPAIVYMTVPSGTNACECRLVLTDTHLKRLIAQPTAGGKGEPRRPW